MARSSDLRNTTSVENSHPHDFTANQRLFGKLNSTWEMILLNGLGNLHNSLGDYNTAIQYQRQHLAVAKASSDRHSEGLALGNIGLNLYFLSDYQQSIQYSKQSLAIVREVGDRRAESAALGNLGLAYDALGNYPEAIDYQQQRLAIAQQINDHRGQREAWGNLGLTHNSLGDYTRAIECHQQSLEISRSISDQLGEGQALGNLGLVYVSQLLIGRISIRQQVLSATPGNWRSTRGRQRSVQFRSSIDSVRVVFAGERVLAVGIEDSNQPKDSLYSSCNTSEPCSRSSQAVQV